ncbi:hypothetical protein C4572_02725 [Candidatus Parcubacteria bacterium]|nr:MAG: hypothetical protein C4572_02725 [Candidatus Parcubacteria bacterium]
MSISWSAKRQLTYLMFVIVIFLAATFFFWSRFTAPTCSDGKQNQQEKGTDCGGPCSKECLGDVRDPVVIWSKPLKVRGNKYDAVALVENRNLFLSAKSASYQFKFYDERNILIASREGKTFINPGQKFAVFEAGIDAGTRIPAKAFLEFEKGVKWEIYKGEKQSLVVTRKEYQDEPSPSLTGLAENKALVTANGVNAVAIIYDAEGNAIAASATKAGDIKGGQAAEIFFTWPEEFEEEYGSDEVFLMSESVSEF